MPKRCFPVCSKGINIDVAFTKKIGAGLFGGEGIVLASVTGPGIVYLQSLPFSRLADRISAAAFRPQRGEKSGFGGVGGDVLGGILGGDRSY